MKTATLVEKRKKVSVMRYDGENIDEVREFVSCLVREMPFGKPGSNPIELYWEGKEDHGGLHVCAIYPGWLIADTHDGSYSKMSDMDAMAHYDIIDGDDMEFGHTKHARDTMSIMSKEEAKDFWNPNQEATI